MAGKKTPFEQEETEQEGVEQEEAGPGKSPQSPTVAAGLCGSSGSQMEWVHSALALTTDDASGRPRVLWTFGHKCL